MLQPSLPLSDCHSAAPCTPSHPPNPPRSITVTGATGSLGYLFLARALQRWPQTRATLLVRAGSSGSASRRFRRLLERHRDRVSLIEGDLLNLDTLAAPRRRALAEADGGLWHFAADTGLAAGDAARDRRGEAVNADGTRALLDLLRSTEASAPFFHVSTAYVAGQRTGVATEDQLDEGQTFRNGYERSKLCAETVVRERMRAGVRGLIFRPSMALEASSSTGSFKILDVCAFAIVSAMRRGEPHFVLRMRPDSALDLVHAEWVVDAMLALAPLWPARSGTTYHLTAQAPLRLAEIVAEVRRHTGDYPIAFDAAADPDDPRALPPSSRLLDAALAPMRAYLASRVRFDRAHTDADLPEPLRGIRLDVPALVRTRLRDGGLLTATDAPPTRPSWYSRPSSGGGTPSQ